MTSTKKYDGLEIAIIGMSGRFQESKNYRQFWQHLKDGKELIKTFTDDELRLAGVPESALEDKRFVKTVGVVDHKDEFDSAFFGYNPQEAAFMDPQTRIFHEHCWEVLEDAGYSSQIDKHKIGVFASASANDNWKLYAYSKSAGAGVEPFYLSMITNHTFMPTLASYKLNLRGPSVFVDTACSSSLTAVQIACRSLIMRDCAMAIAGGVSIKTIKQKGYFYQEGMVASSDGHCRTFDAASSGTASGEGAGLVLLKRLSDAIKDGDHIYAIIKSASVNNDGNLKVGYTAPSVKGQTDCIKAAHRMAGIEPDSITYIEAHGTATKLGDPVEIRALNEAFNVGGKNKYCAIGSVKSNVGHLDAAAGIAGLIKTALSLKNKLIPASLHFKTPNPGIDFDGGPFYVNTVLQQWKAKGDFPLRAGVSALGIGGTNAHLIVEEAPELEESLPGRRYKLVTISGKTENAVIRYLIDFKEFMCVEKDVNLDDLAYTLQTGRKHFRFRKALAFKDKEELLELIGSTGSKETVIKSTENKASVVFLFSGVGSQYVNMGKGLYENEPVFRAEMDKGFHLLKQFTGEDYKNIYYPEETDGQKINMMLHTQPAIFLFDYAVAQLLLSFGIRPQFLAGHSIGEYVAACISGVFTFEQALRLVVKRGQLMQSQPEGAMLSAQISEAEAGQYLNPEISLAAVNGTDQVVFSGNTVAIDQLLRHLEIKEIPSTKLHSKIACHSYMMDAVLEEYRQEVAKFILKEPQIPFISGLTGSFITVEQCTSVDYWVRHFREAVRFSDGINTLLAENKAIIAIEVGAGNALTSLLKQRQHDQLKITAINIIRHPKESKEDQKYLIERIGQLWERGIQLDWSIWYEKEKRRKVSLPTYSFEPQRYIAEVDPFENGIPSEFTQSITTGENKLKDWIYYTSWKSVVRNDFPAQTNKRRYLLFSPDKEFFQQIKTKLTVGDDEVTVVFAGETYQQLDDDTFVIDPAQAEHYKQLFMALGSYVKVTDIIYGWASEADAENIELQQTNKGIHLVYLGLVNIMQQFPAAHRLILKRLFIITDALYRVGGNEKINYAQSLILGLARVIPQEYAISSCNIDIDFQSDGWVTELVEEITYNDENNVIVIRNGQRWKQEFQHHTSALTVKKSALKKGGVYLVTGGLGRVGHTIANYLIQQYQARLILTGRKEIEYFTPDAQLRWTNLKNISNEITYLPVDISSKDDLEDILTVIEKTTGPVNGVIHAAGITDDSYFELIDDITSVKALEMFSAKVRGVENIYQVFKNRNLDFVWLTSSLSIVLGGLSYASYTSANAYMNHFLLSKGKELDHWKCVVLGGLLFNKEDLANENNLSRTALKAMELIELFEWSLAGNKSAVVFQSTVDLNQQILKTDVLKKQDLLLEDKVPSTIVMQERPDLSTNYIAPVTAIEVRLKTVFEAFFNIQGIGVEDHFFELGGDSLRGMMLLKRIKNEFNVSLPLRDFLVNANIHLAAAKIEELLGSDQIADTKLERIVCLPKKEYYPLSSAQFRLWMVSQVEESNIAYNMPGMYVFEGELDLPALENSFRTLIERHEILRTVFRVNAQDEVQQVILDEVAAGFRINYQDLRNKGDKYMLVQELVHHSFIQPFDLAQGPMIYAGLHQMEDDKWIFSYIMHHIIGDGWSAGIVLKELLQLYDAYRKGEMSPLTPLRIQYSDYVHWQQEQLNGLSLNRHKGYWLKQFLGELPVLELPGNNQRPAVKTYNGGHVKKVINSHLVRELKRMAQENSGTLFMSLFAGVNVLLYKYSGQHDLIIGTSVIGREHLDLEDQIGLYVNTLALRTKFNPSDSFNELFEVVKHVMLGAFEHQIFPFDQLVEELALSRDISRNPLFDVTVIFQNTRSVKPLPAYDDGKLLMSNYQGREILTSKFDLTFDFMEEDEEVHLNIVFNSDIYEKYRITQLAVHLEELFSAVVAQSDLPIEQLDYLTVDEKEKLSIWQSEFNSTINDDF
jgi:acyl transferase domain-containing protein/acyl carrier protein